MRLPIERGSDGAVERTVAVLRALAGTPAGASLTELAKATGIPTSTVHRNGRAHRPRRQGTAPQGFGRECVMTGPAIVVAGVGRFGDLHVRVWTEAGARVVGVVDTDPDRLAEVARRRNVPRTGADLGALLDEVRPDAVVIATDEASHPGLAITALEAGCHVFVEKPLALSAADAGRIAEVAAARGRQVVAGHISRFTAQMTRMRAAVQGGAVGRLCALRCGATSAGTGSSASAIAWTRSGSRASMTSTWPCRSPAARSAG
jgi:hypothetical protein